MYVFEQKQRLEYRYSTLFHSTFNKLEILNLSLTFILFAQQQVRVKIWPVVPSDGNSC